MLPRNLSYTICTVYSNLWDLFRMQIFRINRFKNKQIHMNLMIRQVNLLRVKGLMNNIVIGIS